MEEYKRKMGSGLFKMVSDKECYNLTQPQINIWETERFFQGTSIGNIGGTLFLNEKLDFHILERAVNIFIEKNDSIRLQIRTVDGKPIQYVNSCSYHDLIVVDFTGKTKEEQDSWINVQMLKPFEVEESELFEFILMKSWNGLYGGFLKLHHLISDAWTMGLMCTQLMENYSYIKENLYYQGADNPSYIEYVKSEQEYLNSARFQKDREYWMEKFKEKPSLVSIKLREKDYYSSKANRIAFTVEGQQAEAVRRYCKENSTSPAVLFETSLSIYISRFLDIHDFTLGVNVLNRSGAKEKASTGMYVSTVPIKISVNDFDSFSELIKKIGKEHKSVFRHQRYPYNLLLSEVRKKHNISYNLYDMSVSYQNAKISKSNYDYKFKTEWYFNGNLSESLYLHIDDRDDAGIFTLNYDYLVELFSEDEIREMHKRIMILLMQGVSDITLNICDMDLVDEKECNKVLQEFNDTYFDYSKDKCVHELFEEQVLRTPKLAAVVFKNTKITYEELNNISNLIADLLRNNGVLRQSVVGLMLNRSENILTAQLGILKSGGCYLPIDPSYPAERIKYMLEDSGADVVITSRNLAKEQLQDISINKICLDEYAFDKMKSKNIENINSSEDASYLVYTSGSTGKPKGTIVTHQGVVNFCSKNDKNIYNGVISEELKRFVSVTTISFDIFVTESLLPLLNGLTVVMADEEEQNIQKKFNKLVIDNDVEILQTTPTRMKLLINDKENLEYLSRLKVIILGGESFPVSLYKQLKGLTSTKIFNVYGPTETTVWSAKTEVISEDITIGKPIANTQIYILDKYMKPVPIGVTGEIYIGGDGIAKGYYKRPEITSERFVKNPFISSKMIYKTGDIGCLRENGDIIHLGRNDFQLKIRGVRIELGEIENALCQYEAIKQAVVSAQFDNHDNQYMCAYYVASEPLSTDNIRSFLKVLLPEFMIPSYFVRMDKLPLTPNGKVDRKALPLPVLEERRSKEYIAPRDEFEKKLANILCDLFEIDKISIDDHFFNDLGGDSVDVIELMLLADENGIDIKTQDIYKSPTIRLFSENCK